MFSLRLYGMENDSFTPTPQRQRLARTVLMTPQISFSHVKYRSTEVHACSMLISSLQTTFSTREKDLSLRSHSRQLSMCVRVFNLHYYISCHMFRIWNLTYLCTCVEYAWTLQLSSFITSPCGWLIVMRGFVIFMTFNALRTLMIR